MIFNSNQYFVLAPCSEQGWKLPAFYSRPQRQLLHHPVGAGQDEVPLLPGGVADAGAAHGLAAADEEFEAHEVLPQLYRKAEGPALPVLELLRTQQILRQVHPPDAFQAWGDRVLR